MIFENPNQGRWKHCRRVFTLAALIGMILSGGAIFGVFVAPKLPKLNVELDRTEVDLEPASTSSPAEVGASVVRADFADLAFIRTAFVVQSEPLSVADLRRHLNQLDVVFPDWFTCSQPNGQIDTNIDPQLASLLVESKVHVFPRVSNTGADGSWREDQLSEVLNDGDAVHRSIRELVVGLEASHARGVNIDFEGLRRSDRNAYLEWLAALATELHSRGMLLTVDVPLNDDAFDYEVIGKTADAVVVMAYDEHFATGKPGPIAGQTWFTNGLDELATAIPPQKLIVALAAYGYDWNMTNSKPAQALSFAEAMRLAREQQSDIETDKESLNCTFSYQDDQGSRHQVWLLDAISAWNQNQIARQHGVRGLSLWRLGQEEQALWDFFSLSVDQFDPQKLSNVPPDDGIAFYGNGEFYSVTTALANGRRDVSTDGRMIDHASYVQLPVYMDVERRGHSDDNLVAFTFDDGPDPKWTAPILDVLSAEHVPAAFFLVGDQAQRSPELVKRELAEGHLLGNHTFLHPNLERVSSTRLAVEINATQRTIESITGHQTLLFRPPFDADSMPTDPAQLAVMAQVNKMGYIAAGADVDSVDYERPGVDEIVDKVVDDLANGQANVVVFHDSGGDRSQTVQAVRKLIPLLRQQGYRLVALNELLGVNREALMPPIQSGEKAVVASLGVVTWLRSSGWSVLVALFFLTTIISISRLLFLAALVWRSSRNRRKPASDFFPPVAVLVPAYNEGKVIARTIDALLTSDYPNFHVLVIDDGSTDNTAAVVESISRIEPRVSLISTENRGKCAALNIGFEEAQADYIVTIDGDTIVTPHTITELIAPFADSSVDAVCGNVQVGNVRNVLTAFQDVEYVTSQNYDRRAFEHLNCISVVPGATGAWKRKMVLDVGGYSDDTLTEDADLTLTLLRSGAKIVYATEARSITEAPETGRTLMRQRFRWSFGTMQCLWKHRKAFGRRNLGWVALPNMFLFQVLFPLLAPIGDLVMILALIRGDYGAIAVGYLMFLAMDLIGSLAAFHLDHRPVGRVWVVLIQRFFYRQFMYVVTFRAVLAAVRGRRHGWNKLQRQGSMSEQPFRHHAARARLREASRRDAMATGTEVLNA